jgi:uncharacterized cupin superfamily protein
MLKACLAASAAFLSVGLSGCIIVVDDGGDPSLKTFAGGFGGSVSRHFDRDGDFEFLGGDVSISGRLGGDVELVAGDVNIDAMQIGGHVEIAAGDVSLTGSVAEHVEIAGGDVSIAADISDDLEVAAGDLSVSGHVFGDAEMAAGALFTDAVFDRDVVLAAGSARMSGEARGGFTALVPDNMPRRQRSEDHGRFDLEGRLAEGGEVCAIRVVIAPDARIEGELRVWAESPPEIAEGAYAPRVTYEARRGRDCDEILDV